MDRKLFLLMLSDATLLLTLLNKRKRDEDLLNKRKRDEDEAKRDDDKQKLPKKNDNDKAVDGDDDDDDTDDTDTDDDDGGDGTILSYKGLVLKKSDGKLLKGPYFLNDTIIEFYFRYLTSNYGEDDVLFVAPSVSFWLANSHISQNNLQETKNSLKLNEKQLIFFTINNNELNSSSESTTNNGADGGTHWSLLVYYRAKNIFVHQDSVRGLNKLHADALYSVLKKVLDENANNLRPPIFIELAVRTPKQSNDYDCGLYVMKIAEIILDWYSIWRDRHEELGDLWFDEVSEKVSRFYVEGFMRTEIRMLIKMLREDEQGASGADTG
ncbi:NEDD8-specific protease 1 isoform X2 [Beta vulgaris subsp. vulgaris]|nr:NEDD8-specific protease 1 isoform X2 [Beta vulgaris subsp. vulgaris]